MPQKSEHSVTLVRGIILPTINELLPVGDIHQTWFSIFSDRLSYTCNFDQ